MLKVKNVFSIIAMIYTIVMAVSCFILAIVFFAASGMLDQLKTTFADIFADMNLDAETADMLISMTLGAGGVSFLLTGGICIAGAILANKNRKDEVKGIAIGNIVIGALGAGACSIVAGILAVILAAKKANQANEETADE